MVLTFNMPFFKGMKFTDEHKEKLSKSHLGQKVWNKGLKGRQKNHNISGLRPPTKGEHPCSEETKKKISLSNKGK